MTQLEFKNYLIDKLMMLPICKASTTKRNYTVRCPYCGDSTKHKDHGHFSILIDVNSDDPILYRCFRCNESGLFTKQTLEDLQIYYDSQILEGLESINKNIKASSKYRDHAKDFSIPLFRDTLSNKIKLEYMKERIGKEITYQDCIDYKIILNLSEFLDCNKIDKSIVKPRSLQEIDYKYLGFLSTNNNKIIFRDITDSQSGFFGRYYKLILDVYNRNPHSFYTLQAKFKLIYTEPIQVHVAEGTFDILSIYKNLYEEDELENKLFFASGGFNFGTILEYVILSGVTTNIQLHIYADNDKSDKEIVNSMKRNKFYQYWVDEVYIHRNIFEGEKDFGVPMSRIKEISYKVKR